MEDSDFNNEGNEYLNKPLQLGDEFESVFLSGSSNPLIDGEAQGNWARVVSVRRRGSGNTGEIFACKIMRYAHSKTDSVHAQFGDELRALKTFEAKGFVPRLLKVGYLRPPTSGQQQTTDFVFTTQFWASEKEVDRYLKKTGSDPAPWLPFIIMEYVPFEHTLLNLTRNLTNYDRPNYLKDELQTEMMPIWEFLELAEQALQVLLICQEAGFYYTDHKLEHTIWHNGRLRLIDWNGGKWLSQDDQKKPSAGVRANTDFRNFSGIVLYPLLFGETLRGEHPITHYNGNVGDFEVKFESDGLTPQRRLTNRNLLDQRLLQIVGKALVRESAQSYATTQEYLNELRNYQNLLEKEWSPAYQKLKEIVKDIRKTQVEIEQLYNTLSRMSVRSPRTETRLFPELIRLYKGVAELRKHSRVIIPTQTEVEGKR